MRSKKRLLNDSRLYLILDPWVCGPRRLKAVLAAAIRGGADIVQYRDKASTTRTAVRQARPLLKIARRNGVPLIINDRLDVALTLEADGIHLGQDDMTVSEARKVLGPEKIVGLSCHTLAEVRGARKEKADYLGFGPVFKTKTKPGLAPRGPENFRKAVRASKVPVFAIGGITRGRLPEMATAKQLRVAVCRELCQARDVTKTTQDLKKRIGHVRRTPQR